MKSILLLSLLISIFGCGKYDSQSANQAQSNSQSAIGASFSYGHYSIPATQMVGGAPHIIAADGKSYYIDSDSTAASIYNYLSNLPVSAYAVSNYCVKYTGVIKSGRCPFNPTATCQNMTVQSISTVAESYCSK